MLVNTVKHRDINQQLESFSREKSCGRYSVSLDEPAWKRVPKPGQQTFTTIVRPFHGAVKIWNPTEDRYGVFTRARPLFYAHGPNDMTARCDPSDRRNKSHGVWHGMARGCICLISSSSVRFPLWEWNPLHFHSTFPCGYSVFSRTGNVSSWTIHNMPS